MRDRNGVTKQSYVIFLCCGQTAALEQEELYIQVMTQLPLHLKMCLSTVQAIGRS
jgi:hypothetical protein